MKMDLTVAVMCHPGYAGYMLAHLRSLKAAMGARNYPLVLLLNPATDDLARAVNDAIDQCELRSKNILKLKTAVPLGAGRNQLLNAIDTQLVQFFDPDVLLSADYFDNLEQYALRPEFPLTDAFSGYFAAGSLRCARWCGAGAVVCRVPDLSPAPQRYQSQPEKHQSQAGLANCEQPQLGECTDHARFP
jgi:hypothetical protein